MSNFVEGLAKIEGNDMYVGADLQIIGDYIEKSSECRSGGASGRKVNWSLRERKEDGGGWCRMG